MLMAALQHAAHVLGGDLTRGQILCPGLGHSPRDRSLSVCFDDRAPNGFMLASFARDDWEPYRDYVCERLGPDYQEHQFTKRMLLRATDELLDRSDSLSRTHHDESRIDRAFDIWREARHPVGTPVESYLARCGLEMPADAVGETVRYTRLARLGPDLRPPWWLWCGIS